MKIKMPDRRKRSFGKVLAGLLFGSLIGATVGWLTAPASGLEMRRRLTSAAGNSRRSLQEKIKTSQGNVESAARELTEEVESDAGALKRNVTRRGKEPLPLNNGD